MFILHPYENVEVNGVYYSSENFSKEADNHEELMKKMNFKQPIIEFKFSKRPHKFYKNYKSFTLLPQFKQVDKYLVYFYNHILF